MQKHFLVPFIFSFTLVLHGCGKEQATDQTQAQEAKVTVLALQPQSVNFSENLPARVQAFRTAEIRPQVGGIVEKVCHPR